MHFQPEGRPSASIEALGRTPAQKSRTGIRLHPALVLGLLLAASAAALMASGDRDERLPTPPFPFAPLNANPRILPATSAAAPQRRVVLYASERCPHCHAELARWVRVVNSTPRAHTGFTLVVITPNSATANDAFERILRQVPHARLVDTGSMLARQLRVRVVPTTFFVDASDTVRAITVGQTSDQIIRRHLADLIGGSGEQLD